MRATLAILCLLWTVPAYAVEPTLVRLAIWGAPETKDSIAAVYRSKLLPILEMHGFRASSVKGRATVDSVFATLLEVESRPNWHRSVNAVLADSAWSSLIGSAGDGEVADSSGVRITLSLYSAPAGQGTRVKAGPGMRKGMWVTLDGADGLPDSRGMQAVEIEPGVFWIATQGGLSRYDGRTFTNFGYADGLPALRNHMLFVDRQDHLWLGQRSASAEGVALIRYDGATFESYGEADGIVPIIRQITQGKDGRIWLATRRGVISYDTGAAGDSAWSSITVAEGLPDDQVFDILIDRSNNIWIATGGGLALHDGRSIRSPGASLSFSGKEVRSIAEDGQGILWFLVDGEIFRYDGHQVTPFTEIGGLGELDPSELFVDSQGVMWISTRLGGVQRYDGTRNMVFGPKEGLGALTALRVSEDREGNIWVGTYGGGISRTSMRSLMSWDTEQAEVFSILERANDELWLATRNGIVQFDGESYKPILDVGSYLVEGQDGAVWITGFLSGGPMLWRVTGSSPPAKVVGEDGEEILARKAIQSDDGALWMLHQPGGISRYDGKRLTTYWKADGLLADKVYDVDSDAEGHLWFSHRSGLTRVTPFLLDKPGRSREAFTQFPAGVDMESRLRISCAPSGVIWVGGSEGLRQLDPDTGIWIHPTQRRDWAAVGSIFSLGSDGDGNLLITTHQNGLKRYDGRVFQTVEKRDGLPANAVFQTSLGRDGSIWIATTAGFARYRPTRTKPGVFIEEVVADRRYEPDEAIRFPSSHRLLEVSFFGRSMKTRADGMVYRYRMSGLDTSWVNTLERSVTFEDLARGDYVFEIQAVDRDLNYSDVATLAIAVHPPYRQLVMGGGLVVALILVGWQTARVVQRDKRLREANQAMSDANKELFQANVDLQREQVLERLRGQAQGMQSSEDIKPIVEAVDSELTGLGLPITGSTICIYLSETEREQWGLQDGRAMEPILVHRPPESTEYEARHRGDDFAYRHLEGEEVKKVFRELIARGEPRWKDIPEERWPQSFDTYHIFFDGGLVRLGSAAPIEAENLMLIKRFGEVFGYAHSRYKELQEKEAQNRRLAVEASVQRLRAEVQSMDEASDFERILSLLTESLKTVELTFDGCEIDVLDEPVENPKMEHFEAKGFRYTTFRMDPQGSVTAKSYNTPAPFPGVIERTIERFNAGEPWQGMSEDERIVEVPAGSYGRLRLTATDREQFTDDEVATLREFADAVALGYARYLDIREIQEATVKKSAFLASMSHELRTPMNAIKGFTNLVLRRDKSMEEKSRENLEKVDRASDHLLGMINDLLDLSKIEAGRMDVNPEQFDVKELVATCCDTVSPLIQEGVELKQEVDDGEANTDKARVQQMVINLLSNAIKFTDSGSVTVKAERESGRENLVISVTDTGKGIPADELPTLFDEYRQVEGSESSVQKGTGLGLSITKKFAELLGGSIGVESEVGKGSTFTVRVPVEYTEDA